MPWKSDSSYVGMLGVIRSGSLIITGRTKAGKTWMAAQNILAYGQDEVLVVHNGGALDSLLPYEPLIEDGRTYEEVAGLLDRLQQANALPRIIHHDDLTAFGDLVELTWDKRPLTSKTDKDRNIEKYRGVRVDGTRYVNLFNRLPVINIYHITEGSDGKLMFPGQAFLNNFTRMVGAVLTLRCTVDKNKDDVAQYKRFFSTMGVSGEFGGDRTGRLLPEEPPSLPAILDKLFGMKPTHEVQYEPDGSMRRTAYGV